MLLIFESGIPMQQQVEPLEVQVQDGVTFVRVGGHYGNFEEDAVEKIREELFAILDAAAEPLLCIDFSRSKYFGSAFMGVLFRVWKRVHSKDGGNFAMCSLTEEASSIIRAAQLQQLWPVCENRDEVIATFRQSPDDS